MKLKSISFVCKCGNQYELEAKDGVVNMGVVICGNDLQSMQRVKENYEVEKPEPKVEKKGKK